MSHIENIQSLRVRESDRERDRGRYIVICEVLRSEGGLRGSKETERGWVWGYGFIKNILYFGRVDTQPKT